MQLKIKFIDFHEENSPFQKKKKKKSSLSTCKTLRIIFPVNNGTTNRKKM